MHFNPIPSGHSSRLTELNQWTAKATPSHFEGKEMISHRSDGLDDNNQPSAIASISTKAKREPRWINTSRVNQQILEELRLQARQRDSLKRKFTTGEPMSNRDAFAIPSVLQSDENDLLEREKVWIFLQDFQMETVTA